jgi:probable F420-dependent oxidoreductase
VRVDRFVEGLRVMKGLFAEGPCTFAGSHYTVTALEGLPKPVQQPWPPFLIGGGGKRVLSIAAREADIIGINGTMAGGKVDHDALMSMSASAVDEKVGWVLAAAGDRMADIELNVRSFFVSVTDDRNGATEGIASAIGQEPAMVLDTPFALIGTTKQIVEDLIARRERWGFSYVIVGANDVGAFDPVVAELNGR